MISPKKPSGILETWQDKYRRAEMRIGELERERERLMNHCAWLRVGVEALGRHSNLEPQEAKKVIDDFITSKEAELADKMKADFKAKLAAGDTSGFRIVDNRDAPPGENGR